VGRGSRLFRMLAEGAAAAVVCAMCTGAPATAAPSQGGARVGSVSKTELLINGDVLTVTGKQAEVAMAGTGLAAAVTEVRLDGRLYAIPVAALPFLGRGLDLSLFDTSALPGGGRLPVRVTYLGGVPRLPGITITGAAGGVATGYLTEASAPLFGAALARQLAADHSRGSYGTDGLFGGGVSVSLARAALPSPQSRTLPRFPMHVLTIHGFNVAGKPDTGDMVYLLDTDNTAYFGDPYESGNLFYHGTAKYSVPDGHYWALGVFFSFGTDTPASVRLVVDARFTVAGNTAIAISARSATQQVTFATAKPASVSYLMVQLVDKLGLLGASFYEFLSVGDLAFWVSPTRQRLASGTLQEFVAARLVPRSQGPPQPDAQPTAYYLSFDETSGTIGSQRFTADSLATVRASYSSDVATTGAFTLTPVPLALLEDGFITGFLYPVSVPAVQTEYVTAGPGLYWLGHYYQSASAQADGQADATRTFTRGETVNLGWNTYPLHTALNTSVLGGDDPFGAYLSATRDDNVLTLDVTPFSDSTTGHTGSGFSQGILGPVGTISGSYQIAENGKTIAAGNAVRGGPAFGTQVNLSARPSTVSFTLHASRTGALFPLSTATTTTWTWRSADGPQVNLPAGWTCADGSPSCSVEPLLTLDYDVAGIAVDGTAPAGAQVVRLTVGHQQFASAPAIRAVTASVSFDDGATWQPASVTGAGGTRYAVFGAPAGSYVALKVSAADAAGNTVTETLMRAYATATQAFTARTSVSGRRAADASNAARAAGYLAACPAVGPTELRCLALYAPRNAAAVARAAGFGDVSAPAGWGATDIERAYRLPVSRNPHQTVAVVEAYDTPALQSYLDTYRREYGLPPCTTANGCFRKVNAAGRAGPLPANGTGSGWDLEATLDADMVSAACPRCHLLVVEAASPAVTALAAAEDTAVRLGAAAVSNSYGGRETGLDMVSARAYDHPGHAIVVSSGDYGYTAANFPADLATVTAVGGTELSRARNARGWLETVWDEDVGASGSGCSAYVAKPRWQRDPHCPGRTVADVAALAWDIAVYDKHYGGWVQVAGTSAAAPIVAGVYGLAGNAAKIKPGYEYAHTRSLFDITEGNNDWWAQAGGAACGYDYLCVAKKGYDAPSGLGTPDGTGAF
jgi:Subtilase family